MPPRPPRPLRSVAAALALGLSCAGCAGAPSLPGEYAIRNAQPPEDKTFLSKRIMILADEQVHYLYGKPGWLRTELTNQLVSTAIRPVQLDFFGRYLLEWMVDQTKPDVPLVFLGDALDFSCAQEWEIFKASIQGTRGARTWALTPGNHDGFYFGNYQPADKRGWADACTSGDAPGTPMDKAAFVEAYLRAVADEADPGAQQIKRSLEAPGPRQGSWDGSWEYAGAGAARPFFRAIAWHVDHAAPWRSFVVQEVDLTLPGSPRRVTAVLLDTSSYEDPPSLLPTSNAGLHGDVPPAERAWVERWLARDHAEGASPLLMGHHTFNGLSAPARAALDALRRKDAVPLWISAHTHLGQWFVHPDEGAGWPELNVGSTLDYPPEYRLFNLSRSRGKLLATAELHRAEPQWLTELSQPIRCEAIWEALPEDQDFYITYKSRTSISPTATQDDLMTALLHAHQRLLGSTNPMKVKPEPRPEALLQLATDTKATPRWPAGCADDACVLAAIGKALSESSRAPPGPRRQGRAAGAARRLRAQPEGQGRGPSPRLPSVSNNVGEPRAAHLCARAARR